MFRVLKSILFSLFILCSFFTAVSAQSIPGVNEPVTFTVSPEFPRPDTDVTVSVQSNNTDLNRADFIWYVNGKVFRKGPGIKNITVSSGKSGTLTTVSVDVTTVDIGKISNEVSFRPAEVDLVWQTDGYVPPFYKGKALELYGSSFKVVALPDFYTAGGKKMDPKTLIYSWKKNGTADGQQSGYGKDSFKSSQTSYVRGGDTISVEVSTNDRSIGAKKVVVISPQSADIVFYENSPLYGIVYEKAFENTFTLTAEELTLHAEPYNLSTYNPLSGVLGLDWSLNGSDVSAFKDSNELVLRRIGNVSGQSDINLTIQHKEKILQGGQVGITIFQ